MEAVSQLRFTFLSMEQVAHCQNCPREGDITPRRLAWRALGRATPHSILLTLKTVISGARIQGPGPNLIHSLQQEPVRCPGPPCLGCILLEALTLLELRAGRQRKFLGMDQLWMDFLLNI